MDDELLGELERYLADMSKEIRKNLETRRKILAELKKC